MEHEARALGPRPTRSRRYIEPAYRRRMLWNVLDLAMALGRHPQVIRRMCHAGEFPGAFKEKGRGRGPGRAPLEWRIPWAGAETWAEKRVAATQADLAARQARRAAKLAGVGVEHRRAPSAER